MNDEQDIVLVVKDTNIIFDLWDLDLMDQFLQVDLSIHITAFVYNEINDKEQKFESYFKANLITKDTGDLERILDVIDKYNIGSLADASVLEFALRKDAMVLTNDERLKKIISNNGIEVHGLLWCIEYLIIKGKITWSTAKLKVEKWMSINERTPKDLCKKFIKEIEIKYSK